MENKQEPQLQKMGKMEWVKDKAGKINNKVEKAFDNLEEMTYKALDGFGNMFDFFEKKGNTFMGIGASAGYISTGAYLASGNIMGAFVATLVAAMCTAGFINGLKNEEREKVVGNEYKKIAKHTGLTEVEVKNVIEKAVTKRMLEEETKKSHNQNGNVKFSQIKSLNNNDNGFER